MRAVSVEHLVDGADEVHGSGLGLYVTGEDGLIGDIGAVVGGGIVGVLVDYVAGEVDACEDALAARVGEEGCVGGFGGRGLGVTSDGAGSYADVAAELDLVVEEAVEGVVGGADEDEICGLATSLEAEAGTGELDEGRCAPAVASTAANDTLTILSAKDEGSFFEAGDDGDAGGFGGDVIRDAFVGGCHELMQDHVGCFDALIELCNVGCGRGGYCHGQG